MKYLFLRDETSLPQYHMTHSSLLSKVDLYLNCEKSRSEEYILSLKGTARLGVFRSDLLIQSRIRMENDRERVYFHEVQAPKYGWREVYKASEVNSMRYEKGEQSHEISWGEEASPLLDPLALLYRLLYSSEEKKDIQADLLLGGKRRSFSLEEESPNKLWVVIDKKKQLSVESDGRSGLIDIPRFKIQLKTKCLPPSN